MSFSGQRLRINALILSALRRSEGKARLAAKQLIDSQAVKQKPMSKKGHRQRNKTFTVNALCGSEERGGTTQRSARMGLVRKSS